MIITLSGANFSSSNIGNLANSGPFDVTVSCSNVSGASVSLNGGGKSASGTGSAKLTAVPSGTSVTYTISATGYNTASGTINVSFSNVTRSISLTAVGSVTPPVNPDQPGTGGSGETTTYYIQSLKQLEDSGNDFSKKTNLASNKDYAWAFNDFNSKLAGKTINTIRMMIDKVGNGKFNIGLYDSTTHAISDTRVINISAEHEGTIQTYTFEDLTIPTGKYFVWNCALTGGEATGYYILKANLDPLAVETSKWYFAKSTGLEAFATHELVFVADIGYTGNSQSDTPTDTPTEGEWYIQSYKQLKDSGNNISANRVKLAASNAYAWAFNEFNSKLAGKTINAIRMIPSTAGPFEMGIFDPSTNTISNKISFTIDSADINTEKLYKFNSLTIPTGKYFVWNATTSASNAGCGYYVLKDKLDSTKVETSKWYQVKPSGLAAFSNYELAFVADIGYIA